MEKIELKELVGGALQEQFAKSFEKVVENLLNPNTPYKNTREIAIKLKFKQNEHRDDVKVDISVAEKLAPQAPMLTSFAIGKNLQSGEVYAEEYGKQIRGQMSISDVQPQPGEVIDPETGEILTEQHENVIDLRKAAAK